MPDIKNGESKSSRKCGAKTRAGSTCRRALSPASDRCHLHHGATPDGMASPQFIDSKAIGFPAEMLQLREEIALTEIRTNELLRQLDSSDDNSQTWAEIMKTFELRLNLVKTHVDVALVSQWYSSAKELATLVRSLLTQ